MLVEAYGTFNIKINQNWEYIKHKDKGTKQIFYNTFSKQSAEVSWHTKSDFVLHFFITITWKKVGASTSIEPQSAFIETLEYRVHEQRFPKTHRRPTLSYVLRTYLSSESYSLYPKERHPAVLCGRGSSTVRRPPKKRFGRGNGRGKGPWEKFYEEDSAATDRKWTTD